MSQRFYPSRSFFVDSAGAPYAGGKLYFYESGTTTPLDTFSDQALSIANANPVIANSAGLFGEIFLQAQEYKVVLTTSDDVTVWTADPVKGSTTATVAVSDIANGTDGELITWDASGQPTTVAVGTANHVLTSNGTGAPPTFQAIPATPDASSTVAGLAELATAAEVTSETATGGDGPLVVQPSTMKNHHGVAKAWVSFSGDGTVTILDSYNVSSVTDNGTGDYTINFSITFANANYIPVMSCRSVSPNVLDIVVVDDGNAPTTTSLRINTTNTSGTLRDVDTVYVAVFGDV